MTQHVDDDRLPSVFTADSQFIGVPLPNGGLAVQELDNPAGWLVCSVAVPAEP